jgi:hypothetical protein
MRDLPAKKTPGGERYQKGLSPMPKTVKKKIFMA